MNITVACFAILDTVANTVMYVLIACRHLWPATITYLLL